MVSVTLKEKLKDIWDNHLYIMLFILLLIFTCLCLLYLIQLHKNVEKVETFTPAEVHDTNAIMSRTDMNKQNAEEFAHKIDSNVPSASYERHYEGDPYKLIDEVREDAQKGSQAAIPELRQKSDYTFVVPKVEDADKKATIDIYKVNTYKNWELGIGAGVHDGDTYIPVSIQRNYSRTHSVAFEVHYDIDDKKINGGEVQWKCHF